MKAFASIVLLRFMVGLSLLIGLALSGLLLAWLGDLSDSGVWKAIAALTMIVVMPLWTFVLLVRLAKNQLDTLIRAVCLSLFDKSIK